jgi:hypothetical protein
MPTPNNMHQVLRGPPGPPGPRMPPVKDPSPWNTRGWSADPAENPGMGWGDGGDPLKRDLGGWGDSQWSIGGGARPRLPPNPLAQRGSPGWDEPPQEVGWSGGGMKPVGQVSNGVKLYAPSLTSSQSKLGCLSLTSLFSLVEHLYVGYGLTHKCYDWTGKACQAQTL